jgi:hypothetical protein
VQHSATSAPEVKRQSQQALTWFTKKRAEWDRDADSRWHE